MSTNAKDLMTWLSEDELVNQDRQWTPKAMSLMVQLADELHPGLMHIFDADLPEKETDDAVFNFFMDAQSVIKSMTVFMVSMDKAERQTIADQLRYSMSMLPDSNEPQH